MIVPPSQGVGKIVKHSFKLLCIGLARSKCSIVVTGDGSGRIGI